MSINLKNHHYLFVCVVIISLVFAYFVEYVMEIAACPLCIYQRFPYLIILTISIIGMANKKPMLELYFITCLFSLLLSAYHSGVERGLFELSSFCKPLNSISNMDSLDDFQNMLYNQPIGMCNKPALVILNFSMAEWNFILNICLIGFILLLKLKRTDNA
ncbi:MAG: hypothetical protein DGJ47_000156 [Rickettsiaceae bacterium]